LSHDLKPGNTPGVRVILIFGVVVIVRGLLYLNFLGKLGDVEFPRLNRLDTQALDRGQHRRLICRGDRVDSARAIELGEGRDAFNLWHVHTYKSLAADYLFSHFASDYVVTEQLHDCELFKH